MALGAFLGGLLLADSRYRHQIMADIQPFRGLLLGLFFMSVGMSINFGLLGQQGFQVAGLVGGLLLLKAALLWVLCRITGRSHTESMHVALLLAQAGEFGFILFGLANMLGVMEGELYQLLLLIIALSMAATPLLVKIEPMAWRGLLRVSPPAAAPPSEPIPALRNHVIVAGFGRFGNSLAHMLAKAGVPYLVSGGQSGTGSQSPGSGLPGILRGCKSHRGTAFCRCSQRLDGGVCHGPYGEHRTGGGHGARGLSRSACLCPRLGYREWPGGCAPWASPTPFPRPWRPVCNSPETYCMHRVSPRRLRRGSSTRPASRNSSKVAKPPRPDKQTGYKNILLVLTPGIDEKAALDYATALAEDNRAALTVVEVLTEATAGAERGACLPRTSWTIR